MLETRSAFKAGFFSLLIPGAGQVYNGGTGNYIKAAAFLAIEAAAIAVDIIWTNKGNNETNFFKSYADGTASDNYQNGQYNVYNYAKWIVNNYQALEQSSGTSSQGQAIVSQYINSNINNPNHNLIIPQPYNSSQTPWSQVNWDALNAVENAMGGDIFTHWLFPHDNIQYYKEIAKYSQFVEGWSDANPAWVSFAQMENFTPNSDYYESLRVKANQPL